MYHVCLLYSKFENQTEKEREKNPHGKEQMEKTVVAIQSALEHNGYKVSLVPASLSMLDEINELENVDVIFNACTGMNSKREQANIVGMLELIDIPFVGSDLSTQIIGLHKSLTKNVFRNFDIPTANFQVFSTGKEELFEDLEFPLMVKPESEGSSLGITEQSVVHNKEEAYEKINYVINEFNQKALVEEFLPGKEFTVGVLGTENPEILPILEISFPEDNKDKFMSLMVKAEDRVIKTCPAEIDEELETTIKTLVLKAYSVLGCTEYSRVDVRLDKDGLPKLIELNTMPGLQPVYSDFPHVAEKGGYDFNSLIKVLVDEALKK